MKSPIPYTYDLNTKSAQKVICVTHTDDNSVDVIQLHVVQNGALIDFSGNTIIARMVMSRTHELLSDNVVCTIDEVTKDIMIPIDRKAVSTRKGLMLVEVSVRGVLPQKLTFQFPLLVRVNGSILDDAEITPESQGTIPELLIAAAEELRRVQGFITSDDVYDILDSALQGAQNVAPSLYVKRKGDNYALVYEDSEDVLHELFDFANLPSGTSDYTDLENKPQINSHTLSGNKSSDDLGLQDKLTAGENITISSDNVISAEGGTDDYEDLSNKPKYNINYDGTFTNKNIIGIIKLLQPFFQDENGITLKNITNQSLQDYTQYFYGFYSRAITYNFGTTLNHVFIRCGCFSTTVNSCSNIPSAFSPYLPSNDLFYIIHLFTTHGAHNSQLARMVIFEDNTNHKIRVFAQLIGCERSNPEATITAITDWEELGGSIQIVSAVVNQNGTITFTNSDGSTFTTSGSSVIGFSPTATVTQTQSGATVTITDKNGTTAANISNGADGQDYVLTAQDKSDIADIVLSELPTTQGVLYGSTSN